MKESDKRLLKLSELRTAQNAVLAAGITDENREEMRTRDTEIQNLEVEYRAAVRSEDQEDRAAVREPEDSDPATRELRALVKRSKVGKILQEVIEGSRLMDGPEAEIRSEIFGENSHGVIPFELLDPENDPEHRAVTPVAAAAQSDSFRAPLLERIFTRSVAARLAVNMPTVPPGTAVFPIFNQAGGPAAANKAKDAAADETAGSFTGETLSPIRLTGRYLFRVEDAAVFPGLESVFRQDLVAVMSDAMDDALVNGTGAAPQVNGFLSELADPADPADVVTFDSGIASFAGLIDGITAYVPSDVSGVVGPHTMRKFASTFRNNGSDGTLAQFLASTGVNVAATSRLPDPNAMIQKAIAVRTAYPGANAQAPIWQGMRIIRDEISNAAKGQIALTAVMLWNFKIVREGAFAILEFKIA